MRRLKTLGLGAVVAMALTAGAAPTSVSASYLESGQAPTTLKGTVDGLQWLAFGVGLGVECYSGAEGGPIGLKGDQKGLTAKSALVYGSYGTCSFYTHGSATFNWQNCTATFHMGPKISTKVFEGTMDLGPSNCGPMTVENSGCQLKIYPRTGLEATYENVANGDIAIDLSGKGLKYERTGIMCGNDSGEDGVWSGHWTLAGFGQGTETPVNIRIVPESLTKTESGFVASSYPVSVPGNIPKPWATNIFRAAPSEAAKFYCEKGSFLGSLSEAALTLPVSVDYGGEKACFTNYGLATVDVNGCGYLFGASSVEITCSAPGETIDLLAYEFGEHMCTVSFPAQVLGTVSYENVNRTVQAKITGSGLDSTRSGASLCGPATGTEGTFEGTIVLEANG